MRPLESSLGSPPTAEDWHACEAIASRHGRSFYLASRLLPPARKRAVLATYAWCRITDDIVDRAAERGTEATVRELDAWEAQLAEPSDPVAIAFAATRKRFGVPEGPARDLITGVRMDIVPGTYASWDELRTYCFHVAGTVGLMVAPILGCDDPDAYRYAADLGIAMQLTNILRDVAEDAGMGRLYLPLDEIAAFGCDPEAILAGMPDQRFRELIAFQVDRARGLYCEALLGVPALIPSGRLATLAAARLYAGILDEIEAMDHDVFRTRAIVPGRRKARLLAGASASVARLSVTPRPYRQIPSRSLFAGAAWSFLRRLP
jgi:15-cis-phytoene synthase